MRNTSRILLSLLALLLLMAACVPLAPEETGAEMPQQRLQVVTMGSLLANHIYNIAGDHATITQVIPQGTDPHSYEPTPSDITKLAEADIVFIRGAARPEVVRARIAAIVGDANKVVLLAPLVIDADEYIYDDFGVIDLHMGGDPIFVSRFAEVIRDTLVDRDPDNAGA
jgi:ABC-type Zn uptake system ZnuABC Zn-binding protein ZnuA